MGEKKYFLPSNLVCLVIRCTTYFSQGKKAMFTAGKNTCVFSLCPFQKKQPETNQFISILRTYTGETLHIHVTYCFPQR